MKNSPSSRYRWKNQSNNEKLKRQRHLSEIFKAFVSHQNTNPVFTLITNQQMQPSILMTHFLQAVYHKQGSLIFFFDQSKWSIPATIQIFQFPMNSVPLQILSFLQLSSNKLPTMPDDCDYMPWTVELFKLPGKNNWELYPHHDSEYWVLKCVWLAMESWSEPFICFYIIICWENKLSLGDHHNPCPNPSTSSSDFRLCHIHFTGQGNF